MANLVDVMKYILGQLDYTVKVKSIALPNVFVCETTKHLTVGNIITDGGGLEYLVTAIDVNNYVELTPTNGNTVDFDSDVMNLPPVHLQHGTPQMVNNEYLDAEVDTVDKTPFIWVYENTESDLPARDSSLEATFDVRLFLLAWANEPEWVNDQHNDLAVKPMQNLSQQIIDVINADYSFKRVNGGRTRPRSNFGVYVTNKGNEKDIIDEDLTGVELRFNLEAYDLSGCNCN